MTVYVFGNVDDASDRIALETANFLKGKIPGVEFKVIFLNEDLPDEEKLVLLDAVSGIKKVTLIKNINKIIVDKKTTVHDFDLGFQLKYLQKIGKLKSVIIIGLPMEGEVNYSLVQSILRKLVAQDMQGS